MAVNTIDKLQFLSFMAVNTELARLRRLRYYRLFPKDLRRLVTDYSHSKDSL